MTIEEYKDLYKIRQLKETIKKANMLIQSIEGFCLNTEEKSEGMFYVTGFTETWPCMSLCESMASALVQAKRLLEDPAVKYVQLRRQEELEKEREE